jgi:membrane protease YdiL (CAAX protease family)
VLPGRPTAAGAIAILIPVVVPTAMVGVFRVAQDHLPSSLAYAAGFACYWGTCLGLATVVLGRRRLAAVVGDVRPRIPRPAVLGAALLLWPPVGAIVTRFIPELREVGPGIVLVSLAIAALNTVAEELLWRGVFITLWPRDIVLGWLWPAIGFGAWHLAPQVIHPSSLGPVAYAVAATAIGLSWGWVAFRTGSIRWVGLSHVVTDASGLRNVSFFMPV